MNAKERSNPSLEHLAQNNLERLSKNPYPGRGIVLGHNPDGDLVQVYWIMGRSTGSRNRVFLQDGDTVKTDLFDKTNAGDTSLIIYNALRKSDNFHVVSNGDQTDTIIDSLRSFRDRSSFRSALKTRSYEPDEPNFTPRISGISVVLDEDRVENELSIIRRGPDGNPLRDYFQLDRNPGFGYAIHTYSGDGNPLPSFPDSPFPVPIGKTIDQTAETYWDALNVDNKVALVVKSIDSKSKEITYRIKNKLA